MKRLSITIILITFLCMYIIPGCENGITKGRVQTVSLRVNASIHEQTISNNIPGSYLPVGSTIGVFLVAGNGDC
ncbi:hypothetical protein [Parabacteroides merdae]|uniref:hypothetical protein n=1 Tax=Parabacteroides merdae TaxID=46503 RepID=UPI0034A2E2B8